VKSITGFLICALFIIIPFFACENKQNSDGVTITVIDGVTNVHNSVQPRLGKKSFDLELKLEIDSSNTDSGQPFFFDQVQHDSSGNIIFADNRTLQIHKFDNQGHWKSSLSVKGEGPGEFIRMGDLQVLDDQVWIAGNWPLKIAGYDAEGKLISDWLSKTFYNFYLMTSIVDRNRSLTVSFGPGTKMGSPERIRIISLRDGEENILHTYFSHTDAGPLILTVGEERPLQVAFSHPSIIPRLLYTYDKDRDVLYCLYNKEYRIELMDLSGKLLRVVSRDHEPLLLTEENRESLVELLAPEMSPQVKAEIKDKLPAVFCALSGIFTLKNGYFGVKRVTGVESVELDIFDPEGRFVDLILPSGADLDLASFHFFEDSVGYIHHLEDRDVYSEYRIKNIPYLY